MEAIGGDRGGVDEPLDPGGSRSFEDVARAGQIDLAALAAASDDDEGQVDDDVGVRDQSLDRIAVEDVAAPVFGLLPALRAEVEGAARHADHSPHLWSALQGGDERLADLAGRAGDCNGQHAINSPETAA
jgi:hypothetical protein